jgi:hypothetical protein
MGHTKTQSRPRPAWNVLQANIRVLRDVLICSNVSSAALGSTHLLPEVACVLHVKVLDTRIETVVPAAQFAALDPRRIRREVLALHARTEHKARTGYVVTVTKDITQIHRPDPSVCGAGTARTRILHDL